MHTLRGQEPCLLIIYLYFNMLSLLLLLHSLFFFVKNIELNLSIVSYFTAIEMRTILGIVLVAAAAKANEDGACYSHLNVRITLSYFTINQDFLRH